MNLDVNLYWPSTGGLDDYNSNPDLCFIVYSGWKGVRFEDQWLVFLPVLHRKKTHKTYFYMQAMIDSSTTAFSIQSDTLTAPTAVTWSNYRTSDQSGELVVVLSVGKQFEPIWISDQCFWSIENSRVDVVQKNQTWSFKVPMKRGQRDTRGCRDKKVKNTNFGAKY